MSYRIGNVLYEVSDRLTLVKAAKPKEHPPKKHPKTGKMMVWNESTKRYRLAANQGEAGGTQEAGQVGGMDVIQEDSEAPKPQASKKKKAPSEPKPKAAGKGKKKAAKTKDAQSEPSPWDSDETDPGPPPKTTLKPKSERKSPLLLAPGKDEVVPVAAEVVSDSEIASHPVVKPAMQMQAHAKDATAAAGRLGQSTRGLLQSTAESTSAVTASLKSAKSSVATALQGSSGEVRQAVEGHFSAATEAIADVKTAVQESHNRIQNTLSDVNQGLRDTVSLASETVNLLKEGVKAKGRSGKKESSFTKARKNIGKIKQMVLALDQTARKSFDETVSAIADLGHATGAARQKAESSAKSTMSAVSGSSTQAGSSIKSAVDSVSGAVGDATSKIAESLKAVGKDSADLYHSVRSIGLQAEAVVQGLAKDVAERAPMALPGSPMKKAIAPGKIYLQPKRR